MAASDKKIPNKMYIFCEGKKTEPQYLEAFIEERVNQKSKIIKIPPTRKNTPVQLVDEAIAKRNSKDTIAGDVFWVVYDRESVSKYSKKLHAEAFAKAKKNNIKIAISNVCFEFWILLHFELTTSHYTCYDDLMAHSDIKKHLKAVGIPKYDKGSDMLYFKVKGGIDIAKGRAVKVNKAVIASASSDTLEPYEYSPYTNIHELLNAIEEF
ncbi:RloB domain-containing protein [Citrobacter braakii]|uniref:RloB family protein n=1 Tax=Citrobacter braakii TaxID=57706 RepID=UPI0029EA73E9|nr:RloB domain-containing protein [Citrobacter braakii]HEJ9267197.1 RloB domain-containing protein [Klebsiella oxytoca]